MTLNYTKITEVTTNMNMFNMFCKNPKRKNMKTKLLLLILVLASVLKAEVSQNLLGTWIIDKEATTKEFKNIPKEPKLSDKRIVSVLNRMSNISHVLTKESFKLLMAGRERASLKVIGQKELGGNKVIEVTTSQKGKEIKISLTFVPRDNGSFIIKSSQTNDMDYLVWKKK